MGKRPLARKWFPDFVTESFNESEESGDEENMQPPSKTARVLRLPSPPKNMNNIYNESNNDKDDSVLQEMHVTPGGPSCSTPAAQSHDAFPMSTEKFQKRILFMLSEIREDVKKLGRKVEPEDSEFHITKLSSLEEQERLLLVDKTKRQLLLKRLCKVGGVHLRDNTNKVLGRIMTNELMSRMNMKGNRGKVAFGGSQVFQLVKEAVLRTQSGTETDIIEAISRFLKYAPDRIGGGRRKKGAKPGNN